MGSVFRPGYVVTRGKVARCRVTNVQPGRQNGQNGSVCCCICLSNLHAWLHAAGTKTSKFAPCFDYGLFLLSVNSRQCNSALQSLSLASSLIDLVNAAGELDCGTACC